MDHSSHEGRKHGFFASRGNIVLVGFFILGGFYLLAEHRAHLWLVLPWLLLLACPLMHLFMHHGNQGGRKHSGAPASAPEDKP
jgi:hypothetical protein